MAGADPRLDFSDLRAAPRVVVLGGASRIILNRTLFGLARAVTPHPYWVEIRGEDATPDGPGPADLGWVEPDRLIHIGQLFGTPPAGAPPSVEFALISFLREPSPGAIATAMRLPPVPSAPEGIPAAVGPPRVVAIANVDRVDSLYPETPRAMQTVVRAFLKAGVVPYFSTRQPTKRRSAADFVFHVTAASLAEWRSGTLTCEKAPDGASWKIGDTVPLPRLATVAAALAGTLDDLPSH